MSLAPPSMPSVESRALVTTAHGGPEVMALQVRSIPQPGPQQVRVRMHAAAFNHLDLWVRRGIPAGHWPVPIVPCADGAGVVEAIGEGVAPVGPCAPGSAVVLYPVRGCMGCAACRRGDLPLCRQFGMLGENEDGCARDHVIVPAWSVLPLPPGLSFVEAAALPTTMLTAWHMLAKVAALQPGEVVLVHGGRSGVGSAGIQIAKLLGAFVIASVRSADDAPAVRNLGADDVIDTGDAGWPKAVRARWPEGVDVVFEHLGGAIMEASLRVVRKGGRIVTCGATTGHAVSVDLRKVFFHSVQLLGSTMGTLAELETILTLAGRRQLRAAVGAVRPLTAGAEAMALLEARGVAGKVVLTLTDGAAVDAENAAGAGAGANAAVD